MALTVSGLSAYTDRAKKIFQSTFFSEDLSTFETMTGVVGNEYINFIQDETVLQAAGCGLTVSGDTTLSQRTIGTKGIENIKRFCDDESAIRYKSVTQADLAKVLTNEIVSNEKTAIDKLIFQGKVANGDIIDGFYKYVEGEGLSLGTTGTTTSSNIDDRILSLIAAATTSGLTLNGPLTIYMNETDYNLFRVNRFNNSDTAGLEPLTRGQYEMDMPGYVGQVILAAKPALAGVDDMWITYPKNMIIVRNELTKVSGMKWVYDAVTGYAYYKSIHQLGTNIKFPNMIIRLR